MSMDATTAARWRAGILAAVLVAAPLNVAPYLYELRKCLRAARGKPA